MRAVLLLGLFFYSGFGIAQTASLPTWLIDSAIYEVKQGRQCQLVIQAQAHEIESLGKELLQTNKALTLKVTETGTLTSLLANSKNSQEIQGLQFQKDLNLEKRKTKRWRKVAVLETIGVIVGLILLL